MKAEKRTVPKIIIFLLIFISLTALHGAVSAYLYRSQYHNNLELIQESQDNMISFEQARFQTELQDVILDLLLLGGIVQTGLDKGDSEYRDFVDLLGGSTGRYELIRVVSADGQVLFQQDFSDANTGLTATDQSRRFYFQELKSDPDSIYISPLELKEESGLDRDLYIPVLRIGKGLIGGDGEADAYLILSYKGSIILDKIGEYAVLPADSFKTYLINNEGYFLKSPDEAAVYGNQISERQDMVLSKVLPDVWLQMQMDSEGSFFLNGNMYLYRSIDLGDIIPEDWGRFVTESNLNHRTYYLVYETPRSVMKSLSFRILKSLLFPVLVTQAIILAISVMLSQWINRLQRYQEKLLHFSSMDDLTGCMNRRTGRKILETSLSLGRRRYSPLSVAYLDLNNLKTVNDRMGHREGDHYILTMVDLIREQLRSSDYFIRMGGDEFLLILPDCSGKEARKIRRRVLVKEYKLNEAHIYPYTLGMSWGIMEVLPDSSVTAAGILAQSDKLMYEEKNSYPVVDEQMIREVDGGEHSPVPEDSY